MRLNAVKLVAIAALLTALCGCAAFGTGTASQKPMMSAALPSVLLPSAEPIGTASRGPEPPVDAASACARLLPNHIPSVIVKSGEPTVAAAYTVNANQLAVYLEKAFSEAGMGDEPSTWRKQGTKSVNMCIFDGDMTTMTPGPAEADRSAVRVLVVISDGDAQLWMGATNDRGVIPIVDPASLSD